MTGPPMGVGIEHLFSVRVYYEDTDFSGIVYHANYLKFFERGRTEFLRGAGVTHSDLLSDNLALAVRRMEIDFVRPARIDDELTVRTRFLEARGARMRLSQVMERGGETVARVTLDVALIDLSGRPRKLPAGLAGKLAPWLQGV